MRDQLPGEEDHFNSFDELVAAYEKKIFNVVFRILGDYDEAADVTQETFISAYKHFASFRGESKVYTWLYQIAVNQCRNQMRKRSRLRSLRIESLDEPIEWEAGGERSQREIADSSSDPDVVFAGKELREQIAGAVAALPPDYREVIVLREMQGLAYTDIAEVAGISLDNVKTRLSRARMMLRRRLDPYYRPE